MTIERTSIVTCDYEECGTTTNGGEFGDKPDDWIGIRYGPLNRVKHFCCIEHLSLWAGDRVAQKEKQEQWLSPKQ